MYLCGVTHTKGYVKDPEAAQRHLTLTDGASPSRAVETKKETDQLGSYGEDCKLDSFTIRLYYSQF